MLFEAIRRLGWTASVGQSRAVQAWIADVAPSSVGVDLGMGSREQDTQVRKVAAPTERLPLPGWG